MAWHVDKRSLTGVIAAMAGLLQFGICLPVAVSLFPGGYKFAEHFLSDLGRTENDSALWFNGSVIVFGLCLITFFASSFRQQTSSRARIIFQSAGVASSGGLIGIGCTPLDVAYVEHHVFLVIWLVPMFFMVIASVYLFLESSRWRIIVFALSFGLLTAIRFYVESATNGQAPFWQKIVVLLAISWLVMICILSLGIGSAVVKRAIAGDDMATRKYMDRLKARGMYPESGRRPGNQYAGRE